MRCSDRPGGNGESGRFYQRGNVRIRYEETGSGFPLLLIAGGGCGVGTKRSFGVMLTEAIYRRYAIMDAGVLRDAATKIDGAAGTLSGTTTTDQGKTATAQSA